MRKANLIITHLIMVLFAVHAILGAFNLMRVGGVTARIISHMMLALVAAHMVIGLILTLRTHKARKISGIEYKSLNRLFWARRDSGFAVLIFMVMHVFTFAGVSPEHYSLPEFTVLKLAGSILLVISLAFHILLNIKPLLIATGIGKPGARAGDIAFVVSVILLLAAAGFVIYYIRWVTL